MSTTGKTMRDKLEYYAQRYAELQNLIADPEIHKDQQRFKELMQEHAHLSEIVDAYGRFKRVEDELSDARALVAEEKDPELREMAREE